MWAAKDLLITSEGIVALSAGCCFICFVASYVIISIIIIPKRSAAYHRPYPSVDDEYARSASPVAVPNDGSIGSGDSQSAAKILRRRDSDNLVLEYVPLLAWNRTLNFFCLTVLFAYPTGLLEALLHDPIVTGAQTSSASWIFMTAFCSVALFIMYWIVWPKWTLVFDRRFHIIPCVFFALFEGIGNALIIENVYYIFAFVVRAESWVTWIATWCIVGFWQGTFGSYYWNLYVLPEHDTPESLKLKTAACHVPNLTITLSYLVKWNNLALFVFMQTFCLLGCTLFMRFPSPLTTQRIHVATWSRGACGFPRGIGYKDPLTKKEEESKKFFVREEEEDNSNTM
eukprot:TRINITY_DN16888_c0_g1_i1.p1 TRINITY_DN16888_c0_g1~~TRINITY_DN16888_c0_g1_i1.p1  ORF type:complete len:356 (-),score=52.71 TRINITY_DN16888_c0_g1_i1:182-1207(-)